VTARQTVVKTGASDPDLDLGEPFEVRTWDHIVIAIMTLDGVLEFFHGLPQD
jgi:hypothetical protein